MAEKRSLSELAKRVIPITIENPATGFNLVINIQLPSQSDWNNAVLDLAFPVAPTRQRMKDGKKEDYQDINDPDFLRRRNEYFDTLAMRRVAQAIQGGGDYDELADMSLEEATNWLIENADKSVMNSVNDALIDIMKGTKGGAEAKKAAFPANPLSKNSDEDLPVKELERG
jgi:hypothetical protein